MISLASTQYLYNAAREKLWSTKLASGEREAREIAHLLEQQLNSGLTQQQVINNLQRSIENTDVKSDFICMYNQKGIELCHPNPALIGQIIGEENSAIKELKTGESSSFIAVLQAGVKRNGLRTFSGNSQKSSEIVTVYPVPQTDWMVASHANLTVLQEQLSDLHLQFLVGLLLSAIAISLCCYMLIRLIYRKYEADIDHEIKELNDKVVGLQALNLQLNTQQEKLQQLPHPLMAPAAASDTEIVKKRVITYHKDELIKLDTHDIAYVFLDNGLPYFYTFENRPFNSNNSLDEIMKWLDNTNFYRANRQFIINIRAIQSILLYGKNQLKLIMKPAPDMDVIISKNKVAEFKQWLDQ
ncbi:hypothetical protein MMC2321_02828 [Chitinophaga sp. MM2321]